MSARTRPAVVLGTSERASIRMQRRLEWVDTDASGHWHNTAPVRMVESAETLLLERLGILTEIYAEAGMPRVHIDADFWRPVRYGDVVDLVLEVTNVGRTSLTMDAQIWLGDQLAARLNLVAVLRSVDGAPAEWPKHLREILETAGPQEPSRLS